MAASGGGGGTGAAVEPLDISTTWQATFPCSESATQLMSDVQGNMGQFADNTSPLTFSVFPSQPLQKGGNYDIYAGPFIPGTVDMSKDLKVTVTAQTPNAWVFTTDPAHHFFNGTIAFIATNAGNGNVTFSIAADANWASIWWQIPGLSQTIKAGESTTWNNLLNNLEAHCK